MRRFIALTIAAACLVAAAPTAHAGGDDAAVLVAGINSLRTSRGLRPLDVHPDLQQKAQTWAAAMAGTGVLAHSSLTDGITAQWLTLAENVAIAGTVEQAHEVLVASPGHLKNMVDPNFTHVGVGVVSAGGRVYVAEEFMQLRVTVTPAPAVAAPAPASTAPAVAAPASAPPANANPPTTVPPRPAVPAAPKAAPPVAPPAPAPATPDVATEPAMPPAEPAVAAPVEPAPERAPALPALPITPVTHLGRSEEPPGAGASRAGTVGLALGVLLVAGAALADWAWPGGRRRRQATD